VTLDIALGSCDAEVLVEEGVDRPLGTTPPALVRKLSQGSLAGKRGKAPGVQVPQRIT